MYNNLTGQAVLCAGFGVVSGVSRTSSRRASRFPTCTEVGWGCPVDFPDVASGVWANWIFFWTQERSFQR